MRRFAGCLLLSLLQPATALAQDFALHGKFLDGTTRRPVPQVRVRLVDVADTSTTFQTVASDSGTFSVKGLSEHRYRLIALRIGYEPLRIVLPITQPDQDAGTLALTSTAIPMSGLTIQDSPSPAIQKADTTEFRAGAVKVNRDATAEDLVQKMPGVTLENGQVKSNGENVQQVLVNGRPFMGNDPSAAMRNLPAEVVDRIQVYDRMSDQSEFSGFDDGQSQKTMNFILRDRKATFGKIYGGGGDQDRYQAGGNWTKIHGTTRLTLLGMSNNINQQNFSPQDLFGALAGNGGGQGGPRMVMFGGPGGPRGGGGRGGNPQMIRMGGGFGGGGFDPSSFFVGQQSGISTTHSGGFNYVSDWGKKLQVSSSFFENNSSTDNAQTLSRQYLPPQDSLQFYDQQQTTDTQNGNQRFDARLEFTADSSNSVILAPRLYWQNTDAHNLGTASNQSITDSPLSSALNDQRTGTDGNNLSTRLTLRHRFAKRGRNVSADLNGGHTGKSGDNSQRSLTDFFDGGGTVTSSDTLDLRGTSDATTNSFSARVAWTEPIVKGWQAQLVWNPSITKSSSDARANQLDERTATYALPDSSLSNSYENRNTVQSGGLSVLWTKGQWRLLSTASYQQRHLFSEQTFPFDATIDHTYDDVLPSMTLSGTFANRRNLRLAYTTSTQAPSIGQLQNVVDNSNPLSLSTGNPDLRPTYSHTLSLRVAEADPAHSKSRFLFANLTRTLHPISNASFTALTDTTAEGVALARGTQLTLPVNLDLDAWNANVFAVYSRPAKWLKSNLSFNAGGSFNRTPTRIADAVNIANNWAPRAGAVVSSNISQNLDFTLSYQGSYNVQRNTLAIGSATGDYYSHTLSLRFNSVVGPGVVVREEVSHNLQSGVPSAYGQNVVLWNSSLGKKFLKDQKGEVRLTATDVLEQDRAVNRSITETYVQDQRDRTLGRYLQAVFTYTFR